MMVAFAALFGLAFGSFANAAIDRLPRGIALEGRSRCDGCARELGVHELIPLLSYLLLRGRCATCDTSIGIRTPLIELATGVTFAASFAMLAPAMATAVCAAAIATAIGGGVALERRRTQP